MYDICILSVKDDAATAQALAASIRSYKLPARTLRPDPALDYRRILLDTDETPFTQACREKLEGCRYLVLLCSPATRENQAILERLAFFRQNHGAENVVATIVRGEPAESFPESFIEKKVVRHIRPDMTVVERIETIEPVAADLRADSRARWKQVLRYETVRIVASVLGLHPDALEQRHMRRRKNRLTMLAAVISGVFLAVSATFTWYGLQAKKAGDTAALQTAETVSVVNRLVNDLPAVFADNPAALQKIREVLNRNSDVFRRAEEAGIEIRPADAAGSAPAAEDAGASGGEGGKS